MDLNFTFKTLNSNLLICNNVFITVRKINVLTHTTTIWEKIKNLLEKFVRKTNDPFEEKLQRIGNNIKTEINEIRVKLKNFKIQNGLDIANLKETVI